MKLGANHEVTRWSIEPLEQIAARPLEYRPPGILGEAAAATLPDGRVAVLHGAGELSLVSFEPGIEREAIDPHVGQGAALSVLRPAPSLPLPVSRAWRSSASMAPA